MIRHDYHLHSHVSHDGTGLIEEHLRRAEELGLAEICFTEHLDFYPAPDGLSCRTVPTEEELTAYLEEVREAGTRGRVRARAGLEVDYRPETDRWVRDLLGRRSFDFLLGSVHNVGPRAISGPADLAMAYFQERGFEGGCLDYLRVVESAVATGLFDAVAHLDLMKRFRPENGELLLRGELRTLVVAILDRMAAAGIALEINASGLVHAPREPYPSLALLRLARERGVERLTVGSDSHRPETVGRGLEAALDLARAAGYPRIFAFEGRVPRVVAL